MSGLKNSPFGKRLRASQQETSDDELASPRRKAQRIGNPIFGGFASSGSTPSLVGTSRSAGSSYSPDSSSRDYGDRFIPNRESGDLRTSYHLMDEATLSTPSKNRIIPTESDALKEQANSIFTSVLHSEMTPPSPRRTASPTREGSASTPVPSTPTRRRIFNYNSPAHSNPPTPTRRLDTTTDEAYSLSPVRAESRALLESPRRQLRSVCKTPYRVLDAPELADDFYLNLVDWSSTNTLGVGLGACAYLWTAHNAKVSQLCDLTSAEDTISSLSWVQKGSTLAIGTITGKLHVYDANKNVRLRTYQQAHNNQRIGAIAWNQHVLSSGSRDRMVHHRDVREASLKPFKKCQGHKQEVCGLKWSGDGGPQNASLASGGNDNKVCIWDLRGSRRAGNAGASAAASNGMSASAARSGGAVGDDGDAPLWKFHEHTAAVKALAWDPHVPGILATGGGTQDKHIRFWNVLTGSMLNELDTGSQVCNLIWSKTSHELVSTHGYSSSTAQNQICIWKYPSLNMVASLSGHSHRVLYLAMSPDGETIVTGAGDETLRFWNAFPKRESHDPKRESRLDYGKLIR